MSSESFFQKLRRTAWQAVRPVLVAIITPLRFSLKTGHGLSSLKSKSVSPSGAPLPWYTYPAIDFLAQRNYDGKTVLEFGGGQSTLWWAARAKSVMTIEEDAAWHQHLLQNMPTTVDLHHVDIDSFDEIDGLLKAKAMTFDVIIVDGHRRREATALAFNYLAPGGALILDNADGYGFFEETRSRDCQRVDFFGFAPGVPRRHCTSIVFKGDCFLFDPNVPISVIENT